LVEGTRFSVPGDRAVLHHDGTIELLGRDAMTINTGGEKIFAEEVEAVLRRAPGVVDVLVVGRPSARWGQEVVALVQLAPGAEADDDQLRAACAGHLARYKLPKAFVQVPRVQRQPNGKADYAWAKVMARDAGS
jgi:acyl-CoA synthetase (AMP-forming)/AMP-acid ligase II